MRSLRILIVEDEPLIAMDLQDIFEDAGHIVVGVAATNREAVAHAAGAIPFHLAVLDVDLAEGDDGIETAVRLREEHGIDALFVSARREHEARARSLGWKPVGFISKPYLHEQVLAAIEKISHY